jgi:hypothetical protein
MDAYAVGLLHYLLYTVYNKKKEVQENGEM